MGADPLALVLSAFCGVLQCPVGPKDDFFGLGGDSIASEELLTRISAETGINLPGWTLLDYPRPVDLVAYMASIAPVPPCPAD